MFCYDTLRIPWLPVPLGHRPLTGLLRLGNTVVRPLLAQDGFALEAEQRGLRGPSRRARDRAEPRGRPAPPPDGPQVEGASRAPQPASAAGGGGDVTRPAADRRAPQPAGAGPGRSAWIPTTGTRWSTTARSSPGQVVEVTFWGRVHRPLPRDRRAACARWRTAARTGSSSCRWATVTGCTLTCAYHGWSYAEDGRLAAIPHDLFGRPVPVGAAARLSGPGSLRPDLALPRRSRAGRPARHPRRSRSSRGRGAGRASPSISGGGRTTR